MSSSSIYVSQLNLLSLICERELSAVFPTAIPVTGTTSLPDLTKSNGEESDNKCYLLHRVSADVRKIIYEFVYAGTSTEIVLNSRAHLKNTTNLYHVGNQTTSLIKTCKRIHDEAVPVLYQRLYVKLTIALRDDVPDWQGQYPRIAENVKYFRKKLCNLRYVRKLSIDVPNIRLKSLESILQHLQAIADAIGGHNKPGLEACKLQSQYFHSESVGRAKEVADYWLKLLDAIEKLDHPESRRIAFWRSCLSDLNGMTRI